MIKSIERAMLQKADMPYLKLIYLGILAGMSIGVGGLLYSVVLSHIDNSKLVASISFSVGLILIVFLKMQLFTGNVLMSGNLLDKSLGLKSIMRNWSFVYLGNLLGSLLFGLLIFSLLDHSTVNTLILISKKKIGISASMAIIKAIGCNFLVCLAVALAIYSKSITAKLIGIIIPISAFVFLGLEHSIANMFFIPLGLQLDKVPFFESLAMSETNIIPVTIGNIFGGVLLILTLKILTSAKKI